MDWDWEELEREVHNLVASDADRTVDGRAIGY